MKTMRSTYHNFMVSAFLMGGIIIENQVKENQEKENQEKENQGKENQVKVPTFSTKIGKTIYNVSLHFSETSKETMDDKIKKLVLMDLEKMNRN